MKHARCVCEHIEQVHEWVAVIPGGAIHQSIGRDKPHYYWGECDLCDCRKFKEKIDE